METPDNPEGKLPATFLFKTAENHLGLIQILDFTEGMHSIKIRYKLVKDGTEPSANAIRTFESVTDTASPENSYSDKKSSEAGGVTRYG